MRYVYATLIATAIATPWVILALHTRACRQAGAANLHEAVAELAVAEADIRHITHRISPRPDPDPAAARPYVQLDAPDDVLDEPPAPGWLTVREAAAVGQHPFVGIHGTRDPSPYCGHPGCGAISADPVHFVATGILNRPGVTIGGDPGPVDPLPGC